MTCPIMPYRTLPYDILPYPNLPYDILPYPNPVSYTHLTLPTIYSV